MAASSEAKILCCVQGNVQRAASREMAGRLISDELGPRYLRRHSDQAVCCTMDDLCNIY